jgi:hypothetical protein
VRGNVNTTFNCCLKSSLDSQLASEIILERPDRSRLLLL